jgi:hypothetical protein
VPERASGHVQFQVLECVHCGYDLTALRPDAGTRVLCPECGIADDPVARFTGADAVRTLFRSCRRVWLWTGVGAAGTLVVACVLSMLVDLRNDSFIDVMPFLLLFAALVAAIAAPVRAMWRAITPHRWERYSRLGMTWMAVGMLLNLIVLGLLGFVIIFVFVNFDAAIVSHRR